MAAHAGVPVVNALTDAYHPCQILADLQTLRQHGRALAGLTFAYVGDGANNMAASYLLGGVTAGMHVRIGAPQGFHPAEALVARARSLAGAAGGSVTVTDSATEAVAGADVVATDTWVSMGQEDDGLDRAAAFAPYQVDDALLRHADAEGAVPALPAGLPRQGGQHRGARGVRGRWSGTRRRTVATPRRPC